ncbi:MAG: hypothetical protein H6R14_171 [Proteobacteria bacterium]|nr:hypothetical protein [Pseudomonadota bacterium]
MDSNLIYAKTPTGDEAVRQSTRVVQRNLRMVLVQVDGKMTVDELIAKIGNPRLVQTALRELEEGGYIAPTVAAVSVWEESRKAAKLETPEEPAAPMSQFSTFGPKSATPPDLKIHESAASHFSSFGKPILPSPSRSTNEAVRPTVAEPREEEPRVYTKRMSARRKVFLTVTSFLFVLAAIVVFYPYGNFKPALEASATRMLDTPVSIDSVGVSLYPTPSLKLSGLTIGGMSDARITEVRISSPLSLLGTAPHKVSSIEVIGAALPVSRLVAMPLFVLGNLANQDLMARKILINGLQLSMSNSLTVNDLMGELVFRPDGMLDKATFETVDRSVLVNAQPSAQGIALNIEGRAWTPAGAPVSFASLQAKGLLQKDKLLVQNIDTTFLGGILRGNWLLDWGNGLMMAGDGTLSRLDSRKVSAAFAPLLKIDGDMSGTIRLRSSGRDWVSLWSSVEAVLVTEITRGALHGVDLGEAVRRSGVSEVRAGSTKFDRLRSSINISPKQIVGREVKMDAGMVTATGQFSASPAGQVDGNMAVTLQTSVATQNASVRIYGVLPDLSASTRK